MKEKKISAILLAAGTGSRMKSKQKKQFMELNGLPLICYALSVFEKSIVDEVILVTSKEDIDFCKQEIVEKYHYSKVKQIVAGREERYLSVYEGLKAIEQADYVMIHDGARPFIRDIDIKHIIDTLRDGYACVLGMPVKDTIKIVKTDQIVHKTPPRESLWTIQTPQSFPYVIIKEAYDKAIKEGIENLTDDAMVMEKTLHQPVKVIEGSYNNIKITTPEDIALAQAIWNLDEYSNK